MALLRLLLGGAREQYRENKAKRELEAKLGRKVDKSELYSLGAQMEVAEVTPAAPAVSAAPARPMSRTTKRVVLAGVAALVLVVAGYVVVESMSEETWNHLNPFAPKLPQGAFPAAVAGYRKEPQTYYTDRRSYGYGYEFQTYYKSDDGRLVKYSLIDYGSPDMAKKGVQRKGYLGGSGKVLQQEDGRIVASDPYNGGTIIADALGTRMVQLASSRPQDAVEFENSLPYAALGVSRPPQRSAAGVDEVIPALSLLDEFQRDKAAAVKKYDGKTFLFVGNVAGVSKTAKGQPLVALQKEGEKLSLKSTVACAFQPSEDAKVSALKKGQAAHFRCRVDYTELLDIFTLEDCKLE
jgi:hypothetical protein